MIGVEGQYLLGFTVADQVDFIAEGDLELFKVIEETGNILPTFVLQFLTSKSEVLPYLNEGGDLQAIFGRGRSSMAECSLYIAAANTAKDGDGKTKVRLEGFLADTAYLVNNNLYVTDPMSGVQAMKKVVEKAGMRFDSNIEASQDRMRWIQPNTPDKRFVSELWMHSYVYDSWLACGITMINNTFILRDVKKLMSTEPVWKFFFDAQVTNASAMGNEIHFNGDHTSKSASGMINSMFGYERQKQVYNLEAGTYDRHAASPSTLMAMSATMNRKTENIAPRFGEVSILTENHDPNFHIAYQQNLTALAMFSTFKTQFSFGQFFVPVKLLDLSMFRDDTNEKPKALSSEYSSGLYLVSKITRQWTARQHTTSIELCREAPGNIQGSHS